MSDAEVRVLLLAAGSPAAAFLPMYAVSLVGGHGVEVRACLTKSATRWVSPDAMSTFTGHRTLWDWPVDSPEPAHVRLASWATHVVVAPATLNFCSQLAFGDSGTLAAATVLSTAAPVLIFPSLPAPTLHKPLWQEIRQRLVSNGHTVVDPEVGLSLSSARPEPGSSPAPGQVLAHVKRFVVTSRDDEHEGEAHDRQDLRSEGPSAAYF